ncbi:tRNA lysidine(34) synthetase TilS [Cypionkella sp.]|uniref:tRNA lysidine(34) synthetase TilS n=1 Tax=Cypionkella sp. TaxID=2811411 RepID=UPI002629FECA|nr:tRNA lysidine(34) synthetase TilS [Cypionkella sp.]MDB5666270.1 tilS [Cypionkella sp.]
MPVGDLASPDPDAHLLELAAHSFPDAARIGVMVSGGGDSMALLHLVHRAGELRGWLVEAITIDHGLRTEAAAEAAMVAQVCAGLGIAHQTSVWQRQDNTGNLMNRARQARYRLATDWAQARGLSHVAVGHTADDQAETFLIGLARQAGIDGLSGMRGSWEQGGVTFARPLLSVPRADLRAYLVRQAITWVDDPSNDNAHYTRVKARNALAVLAGLGITATTLATVSDNLESARLALLRQFADAARMVTQTEAGSLGVPRGEFLRLPTEMQRRLLIAALQWISGVSYPPREAGLRAVQRALAVQKDATLGGVRFRVKGDAIWVLREARAVDALEAPTTQPWDNRWHLTGPHAADLTIRALGAEGLRACKDWRATGHARDALLVSPAIWQGQTLIAAPLAGFPNDWCAICSPSFGSFVLSH